MFDDLRSVDPYTCGILDGMMLDATDQGMLRAIWVDSKDYRAPLARPPERVITPPWLGELKVTGKKRKRKAGLAWRLYFGEPVERAGLIVVCGLAWKDPAESAAKGAGRQKDAIRAAMALFQRYCTANGLSYPPFEPS